MIPIKDAYGHTLIEIDEKRFPLTMQATTIHGEIDRKIIITYVRDEHKQPTKKIKSISMI